MLSIPKPGSARGSPRYYFNYYKLEAVEPSWWFGTGAELFGLSGEVDRRSFCNLMKGRTPDGKTDLVQNAGSKQRDSHWDLTFSAPKSVSIMYALTADETRKEITEAHKCAVKAALTYMEQFAAYSRRGKAGARREHCAVVGSCFTHHASRENDMQLHSHALVINLGIRADGTTGSLHSIELFRHKMAMYNLYRAELAKQLTERLHVVIEPQRVGFHIQGVPKELCRENSTRRKQIEAKLQAEGLSGAAASQKAAEDTRARKEPMKKEALFQKWRTTCESFGWGPKQAAQLIEDAKKQAHESQQKAQMDATEKQQTEERKQKDEQRKTDERKDAEAREQKAQQSNSQSQPQAQQAQQAKPKPDKSKQNSRKQQLREEKKRIKAFRKALRKAIDRIYIENRTVERVMKVANRLAREHSVSAEIMLKGVKDAHLPKHLGWARLEFPRLFPKAPSWNPLSEARLPKLALRDPARKWGKIDKKAVLFKIPHVVQHEFRVQQRYLVPGAPKWSPLHKVSFPALRFVVKRAESASKIHQRKHSKEDGQELRPEH